MKNKPFEKVSKPKKGKKTMANKINNLWVVIGVALVVGLFAGIAGANLTGNMIRQNNNNYGLYQLYTKPEIDAKINAINAKINSTSTKAIDEAYQLKFDVYYDATFGINYTSIWRMSKGQWQMICQDKKPGDTCDVGGIAISITNVIKNVDQKSVKFKTDSYSYPILIPNKGTITVNVTNGDRAAIILDSN